MANPKVTSAFTINTQYPENGKLEKTHATVFVYDNGNRKIHIKGDPSHRNNNPGNQTYGSDAQAQRYGAIARDPKKRGIFATVADGRKATENMIASSTNADKSIGDFMKKYAPKIDSNDPKGYTQLIIRKIEEKGLGDISKLKMGQLNDKQRAAFADAIYLKEGSRKPLVATFSDKEYQEIDSNMKNMSPAQKYQYLKKVVNEKIKEQNTSADIGDETGVPTDVIKRAREKMAQKGKEIDAANNPQKVASIGAQNEGPSQG